LGLGVALHLKKKQVPASFLRAE
ncbi:unnamed protein product, partial [Rotaria sp. Silwood2]